MWYQQIQVTGVAIRYVVDSYVGDQSFYDNRLSDIVLTQSRQGHFAFYLIGQAILVDLMSGEPRQNFGAIDKTLQLCTIDVVDEGKIFGINATRVRLTIKIESGMPGWLERDDMRESNLASKVESARVFDQWLMCDKVRFRTHDGSWLIGVSVGGPLGASIQKGSPRLKRKRATYGSFITRCR